MALTLAAILHGKLAASPVVSVSIPDPNNRPGWVIQYEQGATPAQKAAAQLIVDAFDPAAEQNAAAANVARIIAMANDANILALKNTLASATVAQISTYVDAQVTDLASSRTLLKKMLVVMALYL